MMGASGSDYLYKSAVPIFLKNLPSASSAGSQFGVSMTVISDLGRRIDSINVEIFYSSVSLGRRVTLIVL